MSKTNIVIYSVLLSSVFLGCEQKINTKETIKPVPVETAPVVYKDISETIQRSGLLATGTEARLSFKIGGIVRRILVDEGAAVSRGQLLAALNLSEINAQVELARAAYDKAERDYKRISILYGDSVATLEQLEDTRTAADAARANLEIAQFNLQYARIYAPTDGKILKRFVDENELVAPGAPVLYFGSSEANWIIRIGVTDRELVKLSLGDSAEIKFDPYPARKFTGYVTEISESVDQRSGTFEVEITLQDKQSRLASGFVARVTIFPAKKSRHYLIPVEALIEAEVDSGFIFYVSDTSGSVRKQKVRVGSFLGDQIIILSDLNGIENVVISGNAYLTDDSKIIQVNNN